MEKLTAEQVYDRLLNVDQILTVQGQIRFYLGDVDIVVKQKDVVGNIMQEWLEGWLKANDIAFATNPNTQMPPDFFLDPDAKKNNLLEVKAFNYKATPGFDIADFKAYQKEIINMPHMLHAKYLIFGYVMDDDGFVSIKKMWLKNVWEITRPSAKWSINVQTKNNVVHKIRPGNFPSKAKTKFVLFGNLVDYLSAIEETVYQNKDTHDEAPFWRQKMIAAYKKQYGITLDIPRWAHIKENYVLEKTKTSKKKKTKKKKATSKKKATIKKKTTTNK